MQIQSIWIENEVTGDVLGHPHDPKDTNSDIIVTLIDGSRWVATFFSYTNITSLTTKNSTTGECLNGRYFWASDMVLVDEITRERIEQVIMHLLTAQAFEKIFVRCTTDADEPDKAGRLSDSA
ncbi:hypothetical protein SE17_28655 [Kouleothrix aurantiaca]|uniref:Uncharacterized protein n=1 Tax=Kouleothrix aurantiaca TaxID=186479 RepID=A0A0P9CXI9_9CHLR|nr:hypothetical protein SE17_28655 [Kouleothrix aurantiaca]